MKFATWNVNSLNVRLPHVLDWLNEVKPDVLCLQEIKTVAELFPAQAFADLGYTYQAVHGQKGYHGVATVSRIPMREIDRLDWQANGEARHVSVQLEDSGVRLDNVYIPAGGDEPDREINPKFGQKLDFLARMTDWAEKLDGPTLICGDFNIAPLESDVWSHKALLKVVSHTPIEVETLARFQAAHGWVDIGRQLIPAPERAKDWRANDKGRRLDHIWGSPEVAAKARAHRVFEDARDWVQCSDHVPLITEFDI
mgnify:CR=1 FL=1